MPKNSGILSYSLPKECTANIDHLCQIDNIVIGDVDGINKANVRNLIGILGRVLHHHANTDYAITTRGTATTIILTSKNGNDLDFVCARIVGDH